MKVFNLTKSNDFDSDDLEDWIDEHGNLGLCCDEAASIFFGGKYPKKIKASISKRRQILKNGWIRVKRVGSWTVEVNDEAHEVYNLVNYAMDDLEIKYGQDFWVKIEKTA